MIHPARTISHLSHLPIAQMQPASAPKTKAQKAAMHQPDKGSSPYPKRHDHSSSPTRMTNRSSSPDPSRGKISPSVLKAQHDGISHSSTPLSSHPNLTLDLTHRHLTHDFSDDQILRSLVVSLSTTQYNSDCQKINFKFQILTFHFPWLRCKR